MSAWVMVALCFGVYAIGFTIASLIECKFFESSWRYSGTSNRHHGYSPWITPIPTFWPVVLVIFTVAAPFWALGMFVKFITRGSRHR